MNPVSRKDFLRLTSLGVLASFLPIQQVNAFSFILDSKKTFSKDDFATAFDLSKTAKKYFYQRDYLLAEQTYSECIRLAPGSIRFYDGMENVLGAQGKFLEIVLLYKNGLEINDKNVAFYDRTARALMRVEIGDKVISKEYRAKYKSESMLEDGLQLYDAALILEPKKTYLQVGRKVIEDKIKINAAVVDFRKEKQYKLDKRKNAIVANKLIYLLPASEIIEQYENIDKKERQTLYFDRELVKRNKLILKEKKKKSQIIVDKFIEIKDYDNAISWSKTFFALDKKNQHALVSLKRAFYGAGKFNDFINFRMEYATSVDKVYAYLGVLDAIQKSSEKKQSSNVEIALGHQIGEDLLKNWGLAEHLAIDVIDKYNKLLILDNKIDIARKITENALSKVQSTNQERINKLLCSYANLFSAEGYFLESIVILRLALKEEVTNPNNVIYFDQVKDLANRKIENSFVSNKPVYHSLYKCYKTIGNDVEAIQILNIIKANDFNDTFLLNKI